MTTTRVPAPEAVPLDALAVSCTAAGCLRAGILLVETAARMPLLLQATSAACSQHAGSSRA